MVSNSAPVQPEQLDKIEQLLEHFEQLEAQFQQVRDGLTHSHRLATLGTLASVIAHEYNNILTPIISYAQLALADQGDHDLMRKAVEKALGGAERAAKISSSLLGFAREADEEHVASLPDTFEETINCLGRELPRDGIQLAVDLPALRLAISPLNLQQVLLNLVLNARRAMYRKGGTLTVTARDDGQIAHITLADTGPGLPEAVMDRLFEPFVTHQIDSESAEQHQGTGLGLCICRDLLRAAGGSIRATSEPGQGATFHITLPLASDIIGSD